MKNNAKFTLKLTCQRMAEQKAGSYNTKYRFTDDRLVALLRLSSDQNHSIRREPIAPAIGLKEIKRENFVDHAAKLDKINQETGLYYFGARYYNPSISLWYGVDPMTNSYPSFSPFGFVANNPVKFVDPNGQYIEEGSCDEWEKQTGKVIALRDKLQGKIDRLSSRAIEKGWSQDKLNKKLGNLNDRVSSLNNTISNFSVMENSSQGYSLSSGAGEVGSTTYDSKTGNINISYSNTANFVHESTHAGQFESGDLGFVSSGQSVGQDLYDEVSAYKAEFAYSGSSVGSNSNRASSFQDITASFVKGITTSTGDKPYLNHGLNPINMNSSKSDLISSYPWAKNSLLNLDNSFTLKQGDGVIFKK